MGAENEQKQLSHTFQPGDFNLSIKPFTTRLYNVSHNKHCDWTSDCTGDFFYSHWHEHVITLEILQGLIRISATLQTINRLNLNAITVIFFINAWTTNNRELNATLNSQLEWLLDSKYHFKQPVQFVSSNRDERLEGISTFLQRHKLWETDTEILGGIGRASHNRYKHSSIFLF